MIKYRHKGDKKMNNQQRASMIILLSMISKKIDLTKYTVPKLANTSFYQVKNAEEGIDFYISDFKDQELTKELKTVFHTVWQEYMGEYIPNESLLNNESFIIDKIGKIMLKYGKTHSVNDLVDAFDIYDDGLNIINDEFTVMQLAASFGNACIGDGENMKMQGYAEALLRAMSRVVDEEVEDVFKENKWAKRSDDISVKNSSRTKAKLLTYVLLNEAVGCAYYAHKLLGNAFCIALLDEEGQQHTTILHTKKHKELINQEFANKFYDMYLKQIGAGVPKDATISQKEELYVSHLAGRCSPNNACRYIMAFVDKIYQDVNFGEDQIVATAVALNMASYLEDENGELTNKNIGFRGKTKEDLEEIFNKNFDQVQHNPKEAFRRIARVYKAASKADKEAENLTNMVKGIMESLFGMGDEDPEKE